MRVATRSGAPLRRRATWRCCATASSSTARRCARRRSSGLNEDQLRFVLREGKKRQIRRMCEAVGLQVLGLKRVRIGGVVLGELPSAAFTSRYHRRGRRT